MEGEEGFKIKIEWMVKQVCLALGRHNRQHVTIHHAWDSSFLFYAKIACLFHLRVEVSPLNIEKKSDEKFARPHSPPYLRMGG
jgi:hypothetical protein